MRPTANSSVWPRGLGLAALLTLLPWNIAQACPPGTWFPISAMTNVRQYHTATLLPDGQVLVAGGCIIPSCTPTASAEVYNSLTGRWATTGSLATPRAAHTATLLPDGQVLVAGGCIGYPSCDALTSAELYDPLSRTWSSAGTMAFPHSYHTATLLRNGLVLVAGSQTCSPTCFTVLANAELYNYWTNRWYPISSMIYPRFKQAAVLLADGRVLMAGGTTSCTSSCTATASAELYDPYTGRWQLTGSLHMARTGATGTLLPNGMVLVTGGCPTTDLYNNCSQPLNSAEIYDPWTGQWNITESMASPRHDQTATLLYDGQVLIAAGQTVGSYFTNSAELYSPLTGQFSSTGSLPLAIYNHTATLLRNGTVLVAGGCCDNAGNPFANAEVYWP